MYKAARTLICLLILSCIGSAWGAVDLLQNGGFETGNPDKKPVGWMIKQGNAQGIRDRDRVFSGNSALKITAGEKSSALILQEIRKFPKDGKFHLKYAIVSTSIETQYRVYVGVWQKNKWLKGIDEGWRQAYTAWQQVSTDFKVPSQCDMLMVVIEIKGPATVWIDNMSLVSEPEVKRKLPPALPSYTGSTSGVQFNSDRMLLVQGKPFFPIGVYSWRPNTEKDMAKVYDYGFNMIHTFHMTAIGKDIMKAYLDMAEKYKLKVIGMCRFQYSDKNAGQFTIDASKTRAIIPYICHHPALLGYENADEPAWGGINISAYAAGSRLLRKLDPDHPQINNHAPRNTIAKLAMYNRYVDISGGDIYPVWSGPDKHSNLPNKTISVVGDETVKNLKAVNYKKPVIMILQGNSWSNMGVPGQPTPTGEQLRFMGYDAIVNGANGIVFYLEGTKPKEYLKPVVREFYAMQDILAGRTFPAKLSHSPEITTLTKSYRNEFVIIAVNRQNHTVKGKFNLTALKRPELNAMEPVFPSTEKVILRKMRFQDEFKPYEVKIWTTAVSPSGILKQHLPLNVKPENFNKAARMHELEAKVKPNGRRNVAAAASGASVKASSTHHCFKVETAIDGNPWSGWNDATCNAYPDWLEVTFKRKELIEEIAIFTGPILIFDQWGCSGIRDFKIQADINNHWKTVAEVKNGEKVLYIIKLDKPVKTSRIRLEILSTNGGNDFSRVSEIIVFAR